MADAQPEVVARMLILAENARRDLGDVGLEGAGQRQPGKTDNPVPQLKN